MKSLRFTSSKSRRVASCGVGLLGHGQYSQDACLPLAPHRACSCWGSGRLQIINLQRAHLAEGVDSTAYLILLLHGLSMMPLQLS